MTSHAATAVPRLEDHREGRRFRSSSRKHDTGRVRPGSSRAVIIWFWQSQCSRYWPRSFFTAAVPGYASECAEHRC